MAFGSIDFSVGAGWCAPVPIKWLFKLKKQPIYIYIYIYIYILVGGVNPSEKIWVRQWEGLSHIYIHICVIYIYMYIYMYIYVYIYGKIKHVPNHQPVYYIYIYMYLIDIILIVYINDLWSYTLSCWCGTCPERLQGVDVAGDGLKNPSQNVLPTGGVNA